jgi:prevent-host-death family protein
MAGKELNTTEARLQFADIVERAQFKKERVIISKRGKEVVAVISVEDLRLLEELEAQEDQEDIAAAEAALLAMKERGEKPIPLDDVLAELGLLDLLKK